MVKTGGGSPTRRDRWRGSARTRAKSAHLVLHKGESAGIAGELARGRMGRPVFAIAGERRPYGLSP